MTKTHSGSENPENVQHSSRDLAEKRRAGLVSVVIPCYNQAHFLGEAIESVLAQSHPNFEIVVVDDGSTDNTSEVAGRYPGVRLIRQENQGLAGARNTGIRRSNGSYLVFLDADDRLLPHALEVSLKQLEEHPKCAFVAGHCRFIADDGSPLPTTPPLPTPPPPHGIGSDLYTILLSRKHFVIPGAVMYQRWVFESRNYFNSVVNSAADYDLYFRIMRKYPICWHGRVVLEYRRHGASMTRNAGLLLQHTVEVLRKQWKHVKGNQGYKEAYKIGMRRGQREYGSRLGDEVRACVRQRQWKRAMRGVLVLLRYYPLGLRYSLVPVRVRRRLRILLSIQPRPL